MARGPLRASRRLDGGSPISSRANLTRHGRRARRPCTGNHPLPGPGATRRPFQDTASAGRARFRFSEGKPAFSYGNQSEHLSATLP